MTALAGVLSAAGLVRPVRSRGFCPACKGWIEPRSRPRQEVAPPALVAVGVLAVAGLAWAVAVAQAGSMSGMATGIGSFGTFATGWVVMMAAMMLPSALPLVLGFARRSEGRRGWPLAAGLLGTSYLAVWLAFGLICFAAYNALRMPWTHQTSVAGAVLVAAGLYALTPLKRAGEARCREVCALHGPLPFDLYRSAITVGTRYGVSCVGCSAGLMLGAVLVGMSSLGWMIVLSAVVLCYKLAPLTSPRSTVVLAAAVSALGVLYALAPVR